MAIAGVQESICLPWLCLNLSSENSCCKILPRKRTRAADGASLGFFLQMLLKCSLGFITEDVSEQRTAWLGRYVQGIAVKRTWGVQGKDLFSTAQCRGCELSVRLLPWGICDSFTLPGAHSVRTSQTGQDDLWDQGQNGEFSWASCPKSRTT